MKKILIGFMSALLVLSFASCKKIDNSGSVSSMPSTNSSESTSSQEESSAVSTAEGGVSKDENSVTVTLPAALVGDDQTGALTDEQIHQGFQSSKVNDDGSITYIIQADQYDTYVESLKNEVVGSLTEMAGSGEYESLVEVKYSEELNEATLLVDQTKYEGGTDKYLPKGVALKMANYLLFSGTVMSDLQVVVNVENSETNEVIDTVVYPALTSSSNNDSTSAVG